MLNDVAIVDKKLAYDTIQSNVAKVCRLIPPLWDLRGYVAVNPFLGFSGRSIDEAAREISEGFGARILPGIDFYRDRWRQRAFSAAELAAAASRHGGDEARYRAILEGREQAPRRPSAAYLTFAERHDRRYGSDWNDQLIRFAARWCAVHASEGGGSWNMPVDHLPLYPSWREAAQADRTLEIAGLRGFRQCVKRFPERADATVSTLLVELGVPAQDRERYLYRLLGGLYGWASYLRRHTWEQGSNEPGALLDLLAIRIAGDAAIVKLLGKTLPDPKDIMLPDEEDEAVLVVFQEALENGFARGLLEKITAAPVDLPSQRAAFQGVFCIDVRSEPLRRNLEAQSTSIQTLGFAGFFGVALDWNDGSPSARCPVLLKPGVSLRPTVQERVGVLTGAITGLQKAPAASFSFVEMLGLAYGVGIARDAFAATPVPGSSENSIAFELADDSRGLGIELSTRVALAAGILKNMGLPTPIARLVLLCGHAGRTANNPHAAGLDCGACGGHGGAINARVAAALLNDPAVRKGLLAQGWDVPSDTHFLPGLHDTTVDEVILLDCDRVPQSHRADLDQLRKWIAQATPKVRSERAAGLGLAKEPVESLWRLLCRRARDWSEVRPEWGLARNGAFIAARRARTATVNLQGRAFLHEYDWTRDGDSSILTLILTAPMVVASWINLQYFASTVDNDFFGCGTKTLHNRIGSLGVVLGNGGDLRTGLPAQSVHAPDGRWYHEPLRLQVVVEAPRDRIETVLSSQPGVLELIDNGWVRLFALDPESTDVALWNPGEGWQPFLDHGSEKLMTV